MSVNPIDPDERYSLIERQRQLRSRLEAELKRWLDQKAPPDLVQLLNALEDDRHQSGPQS